MKIYLILFVFLSTHSIFSQISEQELNRKIDSVQSTINPNDPDYEVKMMNALKFIRDIADSANQKSDTVNVSGVDLADIVRSNIGKALSLDKYDSVYAREFFYSLPVLIIDLSDPVSAANIDNLKNFNFLNVLYIRGNMRTYHIDIEKIINTLETTGIEELYISNCLDGLTTLPGSISKLKNLRSLGLFGNKISEIPKTVGELENLEVLYLDSNPITELPYTIKKLTNLKILSLSSTKISPSDINRLKQKYPEVRIITQ